MMPSGVMISSCTEFMCSAHGGAHALFADNLASCERHMRDLAKSVHAPFAAGFSGEVGHKGCVCGLPKAACAPSQLAPLASCEEGMHILSEATHAPIHGCPGKTSLGSCKECMCSLTEADCKGRLLSLVGGEMGRWRGWAATLTPTLAHRACGTSHLVPFRQYATAYFHGVTISPHRCEYCESLFYVPFSTFP